MWVSKGVDKFGGGGTMMKLYCVIVRVLSIVRVCFMKSCMYSLKMH